MNQIDASPIMRNLIIDLLSQKLFKVVTYASLVKLRGILRLDFCNLNCLVLLLRTLNLNEYALPLAQHSNSINELETDLVSAKIQLSRGVGRDRDHAESLIKAHEKYSGSPLNLIVVNVEILLVIGIW